MSKTINKQYNPISFLKFSFIALALSIALASMSYAYKGQPYAEALEIDASSLSTKGWYEVFNNDEAMKEYGIYQLKPLERAWLKRYLLDHASDAYRPDVSGLYKRPEEYKPSDLRLK